MNDPLTPAQLAALEAAIKERDELRAERDAARSALLKWMKERPIAPHPVDQMNNLTKGLLEHAESECDELRALLVKAGEAFGPFAHDRYAREVLAEIHRATQTDDSVDGSKL